MLKRLFYASASILMLALAYHLGAGSATAQSGGITAADADAYYGICTYASGRTVYSLRGGDVMSATGVPGTSPIVACSWEGGSFLVGLANGDVYENCAQSCGNASWQFRGNVFGPTPVAQQTFGQVKVQYRK